MSPQLTICLSFYCAVNDLVEVPPRQLFMLEWMLEVMLHHGGQKVLN